MMSQWHTQNLSLIQQHLWDPQQFLLFIQHGHANIVVGLLQETTCRQRRRMWFQISVASNSDDRFYLAKTVFTLLLLITFQSLRVNWVQLQSIYVISLFACHLSTSSSIWLASPLCIQILCMHRQLSLEQTSSAVWSTNLSGCIFSSQILHFLFLSGFLTLRALLKGSCRGKRLFKWSNTTQCRKVHT